MYIGKCPDESLKGKPEEDPISYPEDDIDLIIPDKASCLLTELRNKHIADLNQELKDLEAYLFHPNPVNDLRYRS